MLDRFEEVCETILEQSEASAQQGSLPSLQDRDVLGDLSEYPELMKTKDLQELLNIGRRQTYDLINEDDFPCLKVRSTYRIPKHGLHLWANAEAFGGDMNEILEEALEERLQGLDR